jgi:hypothetical protein
MIRMLMLLFVSLVLVIPAQNQEPGLFLAYVIENEDYSVQMYIVDARSGEQNNVLEDACPISFSPDRQFLIYELMPADQDYYPSDLYLLDLQSGESRLISESANFHLWSVDNQRIVYSEPSGEGEALRVYDLTTNQTQMIYEGKFFVHRFQGQFLFFTALEIEADTLELHRWNGSDEIIASLDYVHYYNSIDDIQEISLSPNRQFLTVEYEDEMSLYTVSTGEVSVFGDVMPLYWQPNAPATFAYSFEDESELFNLLTDESDGQVITGFSGGDLMWSANGDYLAERGQHLPENLRILSMDTGEVLELGEYEIGDNSFFGWLSDSQFYYSPPMDEFGGKDLFLYDMNTGERQPITNTPEIIESGCSVG